MQLDMINTTQLSLILGASVAALGLGFAIYGIFTWLKWRNRISNRMDQFVAAEVVFVNEAPPSKIIPREISGSLFSRTTGKWFKNLLKFLGKYTPEKMAVEIEHKLTIAGRPGNMGAGEFYAIRFLVLLAGIFLAYLLNSDFTNFNMTNIIFGILAIVATLLLPDLWLNGKVRTRQDEIRRTLPDALDMLSVCASAGLGFDQSLQKISEYWETELGVELKQVTQEMEMGISRSDALRHLGRRLEVDDLSRFVAIIIQAEKVGMSYSDVLHSQAAQLRVLRQFRAREIANKLPGKMIFPVALFIFPAILAVILGPAIPLLLTAF